MLGLQLPRAFVQGGMVGIQLAEHDLLVGDIDVAKTKQLVAKYFGTIPRGAAVPPIHATTPPITSERRATVTDNVTLPRVYMGMPG